MCYRDKSAGRSRRDYQFKRASIGIYTDTVKQAQFLGNRVSQIIHAFEKTVVVETGRHDFIECLGQLRVKCNLALSLDQITAWRNQSCDCADVWLGPPWCSLQFSSDSETGLLTNARLIAVRL